MWILCVVLFLLSHVSAILSNRLTCLPVLSVNYLQKFRNETECPLSPYRRCLSLDFVETSLALLRHTCIIWSTFSRKNPMILVLTRLFQDFFQDFFINSFQYNSRVCRSDNFMHIIQCVEYNVSNHIYRIQCIWYHV